MSEQNTNPSPKEQRALWTAAAKERAAAYLQEKKAAKGGKEKKAVKAKYKTAVRQWKSDVKSADKTERKNQKKAFKAFKRRKNRTRRRISWGVVLALVLCLAVVLTPILSMTMGVMSSQKYVSTGEAVDAARAAGQALSAEICDEGYVLLKNDDGFLPLAKNSSVNIFGDDAYNFVYGGSGSAGADQSGATSIFEAFEANGIAYNKELDSAYRTALSEINSGTGGLGGMLKAFFGLSQERSGWYMPEDSLIEAAKDFSDTALIVLSSQEVEGAEVELSLLQPMKAGTEKAALIDKVCTEFEHVIIIVNSGNVMELGFLNDYEAVDAAVCVGSPGSLGCIELARLLAGEFNPSGRTVDTYPVFIENEPSYINYGNNSYDNLALHVFNYDEGIYVGYRYYETWFGQDAAAYGENVVFPFGHGLSYTSFTQEITDYEADEEQIDVTVSVTNTGDMAGKDVVELYFCAPYYEQSGIEKSVIELAAFAKTSMLAPGESESVTLSFDVRDMSSYSTEKGCYVLEHGEYKIALGANVHEALLSEVYHSYDVAEDKEYRTDDATGAEIKNLFAFAEGDVQYMSRADKEGSFPVKAEGYTASEELLSAKAEYEKAETDYAEVYGGEPAYGADNGISLSQLKGLDYDDEQWALFLDQFTVEELIKLTANGGWHTVPVERLGVPASNLLDGPSGINSMFVSLDAIAYPMGTVVSSSWNIDMARKLGEAVGDEAQAYGVQGWYAPAMNTHRCAVGGRNNEYYSEDPTLAGRFSSAAAEGAQSKGVIAFMKHFVCNDIELNARSDVSIWVSEQALREIYLRPFELAVKEGGAAGAMSSFSRLGAEWCGGSSALLQDLLRTEWGFKGAVTTDACLGAWMNAELAVKNGNDLMLEMGLQQSEGGLKAAYKDDPIGVGWGMRNSVHNICYALVNVTELCG